MIIRRYHPGEEPAIWHVYFRATHESNARDYHPDLLHRWAPADQDMDQWRERLTHTNPFVAIIDDRVIGMAELDGQGAIDYFYVLPDFQCRGIGTQLLSALAAEAKASGHRQLTADVSLTAKSFFLAHGFHITQAHTRIILGHPAPNFSMAKPL